MLTKKIEASVDTSQKKPSRIIIGELIANEHIKDAALITLLKKYDAENIPFYRTNLKIRQLVLMSNAEDLVLLQGREQQHIKITFEGDFLRCTNI